MAKRGQHCRIFQPGEGSTNEMIFRSVAAKVLNKTFNDKYPHSPAFSDLLRPLSKKNF